MPVNWLDWMIAGVFGFFIFQGYRKGLIQQLFDVVGSVVALILAFKFYRQLGSALAQWSHFSEVFTNVLGFILIVVLVGGSVSLIGKRWHVRRQNEPVIFLDNVGGVIFGTVKAGMIIMIVLLVLMAIPWRLLHDQIGASVLAGDLLRLTPLFYQIQERVLPDEFPRLVISPEGLSFRNLDYNQLKGATCIHCGAKVESKGLVKQGLVAYPQLVCPQCGLVSDGCLTFEGHHLLKGECPYEYLLREPALDCKVWPNPQTTIARGSCPVCGRTK